MSETKVSPHTQGRRELARQVLRVISPYLDERCAYCSFTSYDVDIVRAHINECEFHPMARLRTELDNARKDAANISIAYGRVSEEMGQLRSRLPKGMEHCTIRFLECEKGHGRLTADNWVQHDCQQCELIRLRSVLKRALLMIELEAKALKDSVTIRTREHPLRGQMDPDDVGAIEDYETYVRMIDDMRAALQQVTGEGKG